MSEVLSNNCKIFSFEPIYSDILYKNIIDNNLTDKVNVFPYGVGNKIETINIKNINLNKTSNFGAVSLINSPNGNYKINIVPVDHFCFNNVSLIKIDVENMEIKVLEGCLNLIKTCKPTIIIETYIINELKQTKIFKELLILGYEINIIPEGYCDYIMKIK